MSDDVSKKTRSSIYWNLSFKIPYNVFRFGVSIVIARLLDPKDFGIVSIATMIIFYSNSLTNLGFKRAIVQRKEITRDHISSVFMTDLTISLFMACLFYFLAPGIAGFFHSPESLPVIRVMSLTFVLTTFYDMPYVLFERDLNFKVLSLVDTAKELSMSLITVVLAVYGFQYWSIVWGQLVTLTIAAIYLMIKNRQKPRISFKLAALKELFNYGIWSFVRTQLAFFSERMDRLIVGRYLGMSTLGIYDKAKSFSQLPTEVISANINSIMYSSFSRIQDKYSEVRNMLKKSLIVTSVLNMPLFFGLYAVAPHFVPVILGEKWNGMIVPLQILCISGVFSSFGLLFANVAVGIGNYKKYSVRLIVVTLLSVVFWLLLVKWGITAVAYGSIVYSVLMLFIALGIIREKIQFSWKDLMQCVAPALLGSFLMLASVKGVYLLFITKYTVLNLTAVIAIGAAVYAVAIMKIPSTLLDSVRTSALHDVRSAWGKLKSSFSAN